MNESRGHRLVRVSSPAGHGMIVRYGASLLATAIGVGLCGLIEWQWQGWSSAPLLAAVGFAEWFCGTGPAILSTVVGAIGSTFLLEPLKSIEIATAAGAVRLALFVGAALLLIVFGERSRRSETAAHLAHRHSERVAGENERLRAATVALSDAGTATDVARVALELLRGPLGASWGGVYLVDQAAESIELAALSGGRVEGTQPGFEQVELERSNPLTEVFRSARPLWLENTADWAAFPESEQWLGAGFGSVAVVPLMTDGRVIASLSLAFEETNALSELDRQYALTVASQAAQPLERARLHETEIDSRRAAEELSVRALRLQVITESLAGALTPAEVGDVMIRQGLPALGAVRGAVYARSESEQVELLAAAGYSPALLVGWNQSGSTVESPVADVLESGDALSFETGADILARYPSLEEAGDGALICAPLLIGEKTIGAIQVGFRDARHIDRDRRAFLSTVARQCALALERAQRYEIEREIAETLQRSVLPEKLPELVGVGLAARYLPGTSGVDVGGDWYDVIPLGQNKLGLVVGDVMGKGVRAASAMAQLRNGLRAYALEGYKPGAVLERLNRLAESSGAPFATVVYVVVDQETGVARYASAGHPPAILSRVDGGRELLAVGAGLPLAVDPGAHYRTGMAQLEPGDLLLLYTDGLVESRTQPIADGIDRLLASIRTDADLEAILTETLDVMLPSDRRADDVAILGLRLEAELLALDLQMPRSLSSLAALRAELVPWLKLAGATPHQQEELTIASWEALANAIEHAQVPRRTYVRFQADRRNGEIVVSVSDFGGWREPASLSDRGLGVPLMKGLLSGVEIDHDGDGTVVRLRRALAEQAP